MSSEEPRTFPDAFALMDEMRATKRFYAEDGTELPFAPSVSAEECLGLYNLVRAIRPRQILEIGMEYAHSTLHLLQGVKDNGEGIVVSIDPYQRQYAKGGGLRNIERANLKERHHWIEACSEHALPQLQQSGFQCEIAFIDGNHLFDQTMVEIFFVDKMLPVGGIMVLHDFWMSSIKSCSSFLETNRMYAVVPFPESGAIRFLQKTKQDERAYNFFKHFEVPHELEMESTARF